MDDCEQILRADRTITLLVAELRAGGCNSFSIAAMLCAAAATLIHDALEPEAARVMINYAAECMINQVDPKPPQV